MPEREAYSIDQAAEASSISRPILYDEINAGRLRAHKRGRSTVILAEDLRSYLAALPPYVPKVGSRERAIAQHAAAVRYGQRVGRKATGKK
jgi:excisionase family DNA binding protein